MRAISIREPWAGLILSGRKTIETRTWHTHYRGDLLVCCSSRPQSDISGHAICIVTLADCRPMTRRDADAACIDVYPGAWSWILENVRPIEPFPIKGRLGFFDVTLQASALPA